MAAPRSDLPGTGGLVSLSLSLSLSLPLSKLRQRRRRRRRNLFQPIPHEPPFSSHLLEKKPIAASKRLRADEPASTKDMEMDRE